MSNNSNIVDFSYRRYYGQLFSALTSQFGTKHILEIEDAIQNTFYKSLKLWGHSNTPKDKKNWLYTVAKNDLLNQIKSKNFSLKYPVKIEDELEVLEEDLRLNTIIFLCDKFQVSNRIKVLFILKNIFGLSIEEISSCSLLSKDAIYKSLYRSKQEFKLIGKNFDFKVFEIIDDEILILVEEILYAVFLLGFDSFSTKNKSGYNEDLCLEAFALTNLLIKKSNRAASQNLMALFCFHIARIPSKMKNGKIVPFFEQDRSKWQVDFINMGFNYLKKPNALNKYYLEALLTSKHMTTISYTKEYWQEIVEIYKSLIKISSSPVTKMNLCYCLTKAGYTEEAVNTIYQLEDELPRKHIYFSLLKSQLFEKDKVKINDTIENVLESIKQKIRRDYILENLASDLK